MYKKSKTVEIDETPDPNERIVVIENISDTGTCDDKSNNGKKR